MKIHFFGAARTTTGSMYLIEVNGKKLLLECGLFQGHRQESEALNKVLPFDTRQVDAVVLSHSHLDHAGKLPSLCKNYDGPIHCTSATQRSVRHHAARLRAHPGTGRDVRLQSPRAKNISRRSSRFTPRPTRKNACQQLVAHDYEKSVSTGAGRDCHVPRCRTHSRFRAGDFGHSGKRQKIPLAVHRRHRARRR